MDEQLITATRKKSPGLLRRILWWLWIILLCGFLIFCLIFSAPWKVIALIGIFLAAATILPRIYRKWFWLVAGVLFLAIIIWVFLPYDNEEWRPYTFDKEIAQLQAKYAVPDSENAAVIYDEIYKTWKEKKPNEPNSPVKNGMSSVPWIQIARRGPWLSKDNPELALWIDYHKDAIEQLIKASKYEKCIFADNFSAFTRMATSDEGPLMQMFGLEYMLIISGNNDFAEGRKKEAVQKYIAALKIGNQIRNQPNWSGAGFGGIYEMYAIEALNRFIINDSESIDYLDEIENAISNLKNDFRKNLSDNIEIYKLQTKYYLAQEYYQVNSNGRVRITRDPWTQEREYIRKNIGFYGKSVSRNGKKYTDIAYPGYKDKAIAKAYSIYYWLLVPMSVNSFAKIIDKYSEKYYAMLNDGYDWNQARKTKKAALKYNISNWIYINVGLNESSYRLMHKMFQSHLSDQRGALVVINLRRYKDKYGNWPEKLEEITDVNTAPLMKEFVYKKEGDNFTLYSKGPNNIDDQGIYGIYKETKSKEGKKARDVRGDDRMIWPIRTPQQEVKTDANE